jgi:glycosyltransferase involved in cell wall biosynthesis
MLKKWRLNMQPLISIVLPTYNGSKYISQSIKSCLNQTYDYIEIIVADDASTDDTADIVQAYAAKDSRIRYIRHEINKKLPAALNTGFAIANGDFYTWTSDDNIYKENAIEIMAGKLFSDKSVSFVFSDMEAIDEAGEIIEYRRKGPDEEIPIVNTIGACFLYRRHMHLELGGYDERKFIVEDWDFWMRAHEKYKSRHIPRSLYYYRVHEDSLTGTRFIEQQARSLDLILENITRSKTSETICMRAYLKAVRYAKNADNQWLANDCMKKAMAISPDAMHYTSRELINYAGC